MQPASSVPCLGMNNRYEEDIVTVRMFREAITLIPLTMWVFFAASASGDPFMLNGYTIYECLYPGTEFYNACQSAMAVGESQFLASHQPSGPLWNYDYSGLEPHRGGYKRLFTE